MAQQFRPVNLGEIYGQIDAAKANQAQMENNRMRQEQMQYEIGKQREADMRNEQLRGVYRGAVETVDGAPRLNEKKLLSDIYAVDPMQALDVQERFSKRDMESQKMQNESKKAELAQKIETSKYFRDRLAGATDQQSYDAVMTEAEQIGAGFVKGAPRQFNPEWTAKQLYSADDFIKKAENDLNRGVQMRGQDITMRGQDLTDARTRSEGAANRGVQMRGQDITRRGQDLTNTRAKEASLPAGASGKPLVVNQGAIDSIEQAKTSLKTIIDHPGRSAATGKSAIFNKVTMPGTDRAGFQARLETFKAQTFVPMVSQLKGMGALSDAEGKKLTAAVGALDPNMPEEEFLASANEIMQELELKKQRALGNNSARIMGRGETMPNRDVRSEADKILGL